MWMAALWDPTTGNYAEGQDWYYSHSMWEAELVKRAKLCIQGLQDMKTCEAQQRVSSIQCPMLSSVQRPTSVAPLAKELEDFLLVFLMAWCTKVSQGTVAHSPLLAEADRSVCHVLVLTRCLQTGNQYDWQEPGCDGMDAITEFLTLRGFWTDVGLEVSNIAPPMNYEHELDGVAWKQRLLVVVWRALTALARGQDVLAHCRQERRSGVAMMLLTILAAGGFEDWAVRPIMVGEGLTKA